MIAQEKHTCDYIWVLPCFFSSNLEHSTSCLTSLISLIGWSYLISVRSLTPSWTCVPEVIWTSTLTTCPFSYPLTILGEMTSSIAFLTNNTSSNMLFVALIALRVCSLSLLVESESHSSLSSSDFYPFFLQIAFLWVPPSFSYLELCILQTFPND